MAPRPACDTRPELAHGRVATTNVILRLTRQATSAIALRGHVPERLREGEAARGGLLGRDMAGFSDGDRLFRRAPRFGETTELDQTLRDPGTGLGRERAVGPGLTLDQSEGALV